MVKLNFIMKIRPSAIMSNSTDINNNNVQEDTQLNNSVDIENWIRSNSCLQCISSG